MGLGREESGLTLIEVLLAMALVGLICAAITGIYCSALSAWQRGVDRIDCQQSARISVELIDRELRFADWVEIQPESEIRYKLKGDSEHDNPQHYRRFRLQGEQLLLEKVHNRKIDSYNVVALGLKSLCFSLDDFNNVQITITAGGAGANVTLQSSVCPRNIITFETP